jgi:hypothetical protein
MATTVEPMNAATRRDLQRVAKNLAKKREAEQEAWGELVRVVKTARARGHGLEDIGDLIGVSKARVAQICTGKR